MGIPGLDEAALLLASGGIVFLIQMIKMLLKIQGKPILIVSGVLSLAWAIGSFQPEIWPIIIHAVVCWGMATGEWGTAKRFLCKEEG